MQRLELGEYQRNKSLAINSLNSRRYLFSDAGCSCRFKLAHNRRNHLIERVAIAQAKGVGRHEVLLQRQVLLASLRPSPNPSRSVRADAVVVLIVRDQTLRRAQGERYQVNSTESWLHTSDCPRACSPELRSVWIPAVAGMTKYPWRNSQRPEDLRPTPLIWNDIELATRRYNDLLVSLKNDDAGSGLTVCASSRGHRPASLATHALVS